ncbi:MAG: type VI secretion system-associated FHA domain protein TagH, partial [Steroidobacteraceae bacterium]
MTLRLRIISDHRRLLGERGTITFGVDGGTIGRSADNDWILPDAQRYISAHHARIRFSEGHYVLEDTSTNGIFVNDEEQPLREHGPYRLRNGDVLRLGEYQIVAAIEPATAGAAAPDAVPTRIDVLESIGRPSQTDLGAALNLDDLLVTDTPTGSRVRAVNAYGQAVMPHRPAHPALGLGTADPAPPAGDPDEEAIARRIERLARAASRARDARGPAAPVPAEIHNGLQAFCRGAGIDAGRLPADAQAQLLHLVGQLLREALVGLKDLERAREEARDRFRIDLHADPDDPR